jgi:hypothetical protein
VETRILCAKCSAVLVAREYGSSGIFWACPNGHGGIEDQIRHVKKKIEARRKFHEEAKKWNKVPCRSKVKSWGYPC